MKDLPAAKLSKYFHYSHNFDKIYTYDENLLNLYENAEFFLRGTSWLNLNNKKIIFQTNPGPLGSHVLDKFINFYDKENNLVDQNNMFKKSKYIILKKAKH